VKIISLKQNTPEWLAHRANHFNASDAPAMLGCSKYTTRDDLLAQKKIGLTKDVDAHTQRLFDDGYKFEALARPIAEKIIGEDLSPIVGVLGEYSASFDGITFENDIIFEHKTLNDELRQAEDDAYYLPLMYRVQMEQQLMISEAKKCLFMASKWSQDVNTGEFALNEQKHWWYTPDLKLREKIVQGWDQFKTDLESFVPPVKVEKVEAEQVKTLPVPSVVVKGEITASNLSEITPMFDNYLAGIKTDLSSDQDFADAEANAKNCRETAKRIQSLRENIIAQMVSVNEVNSALSNYEEAFNKVGLRLEKAVKEQKEQIKANAIMNAKAEYEKHVVALENSIGIMIRTKLENPNFADAIKGLKTIDSMHSRLNDAVAKGKAEATTLANNVSAKLAYITEAIKDFEHLFNVNELVFSDIELIKLKIQSVKDAETLRRAEHEAKIKEKAEAEARAKLEAERVVEANKTIEPKVTQLPPALEQEFGKQFVDGLDDEITPCRHHLIGAIAKAYRTDEAKAEQWLIARFGAMEKAA